MTKYYKGYITSVNSICDSKIHHVIFFSYERNGKKQCHVSLEPFDNNFTSIDEDTYNVLMSIYEGKKDEELLKRFNNASTCFYKTIDGDFEEEIIYEKLYDDDGNEYAKEVITDRVFPITSKYSGYNVTYSIGSTKALYYDDTENSIYIIVSNNENYSLVNIRNKRQYTSLNKNDFKTLYNGENGHYTWKKEEQVDDLYKVTARHIEVVVTPKLSFPSSERVEYTVTREKVANELETRKYFDKYNKIFLGKKRRLLSIINKSASNYLDESIVLNSKKVNKHILDESKMTKEMSELECALSKLRNVSQEDYEKINDEYKRIINSYNNQELTINPLVPIAITTLKNKAELAYECHGGSSKMILEYLGIQAGFYLDNYKNGITTKTKLSIEDLDRISEQLLSNKNSYSIIEQNEILRNIAILYFFELLENKDTITSKDLENSYIIHNIKRIITVICTLKEEGIIINVLGSVYDIKDVDELLSIINNIEFAPREEVCKEETSIQVKRMQM